MNDLVAELVRLTAPFLDTLPARQARLVMALGLGSPLLSRIDWAGDTQTFVINCAALLHREGQLITLLRSFRESIGVDKAGEFDALINAVAALTPEAFTTALGEKPKIRVFLSYARADDDPNYDDAGKSFLRRLYKHLTAEGFDVWWDRVSLPSRGEAFTAEIEAAIRSCARFMLVVGPGAVASEYVTAEWRCALSHCLPVTPILRAGEYSLIPEAMRDTNAIDCRPSRDESAVLKDIVNHLREDMIPLGQPVNVPNLPTGFVLRKEPFNAARDAIRADAIQPVVVSAPPRATAVYGYGGIGKSTLAAALASDCDVRRRFKDGVYWIKIGQQPEIASRQADLGVLLGDPREHYKDPSGESGKVRLSHLLANKQALIVLDDVWDHSVVEKFPTGSACRLLLTTRSKQIAGLIDGKDVQIDLLTPDEGARLIVARAGGSADDAIYKQISEELGGLTLAITLAATRLKERGPSFAAELLVRLQRPDRLFKDLKVHKDDKDLNLEKSLSLSYDALEEDAQRRFRALGILALGGSFDRAMVQAIWGDSDELASDDGVDVLVRAGLVEALVAERYTLHRLLRAYARALLEETGEYEDLCYRYARYISQKIKELYVSEYLNRITLLTEYNPHIAEVGRILSAHSHIEETTQEWLQIGVAFALALRKHQTIEGMEKLYADDENIRIAPIISMPGGSHLLKHMSWVEDFGVVAARKLQDTRAEIDLLTYLSEFYLVIGYHDHALEAYDRIIELCHKLGDLETPANRCSAIAFHCLNWGHPDYAIEYFKKAGVLWNDLKNATQEARAWRAVGKIYHDQGDSRAARCYTNALHLLLSDDSAKAEQAGTFLAAARVYSSLGDKQTAFQYYLNAAEIYRSVQDLVSATVCICDAGGVCVKLGEYQKAITLYEGALEAAIAQERLDLQVMSLYGLGIAYRGVRALGLAIHYLAEAVAIEEEIGHPDLETDRATLNRFREDARHVQFELPKDVIDQVVAGILRVRNENDMDLQPRVEEVLQSLRLQSETLNDSNGMAFLDSLLAILRNQPPALDEENPYYPYFKAITGSVGTLNTTDGTVQKSGE